jgi:tetratricopeptide (TPR) repeat protein
MPRFDPPTTAGAIAMCNLQAQIEGYRHRGSSTVVERGILIDLILLRGHICASVADAEAAAALAEEQVLDTPDAGAAFFARARTRSGFHLFAEALEDLYLAEQHGMDPGAVRDERAAIFEAVGRYDEALALRREAVKRASTFQSVEALASSYAAQRECDYAERLFEDSRRRYRAVLPFPVAMLDFRRGQMWLAESEFVRARACFGEALARVPAYAPAQGHFAEVDAELGNIEAAIARLRSFVSTCDDPDYAAQLARILQEAGRAEEARPWREWAAARYATLLTLHLQAFADHAAEFWLWGDADPERASKLAKINFEWRATPRARELLDRALVANERSIRKDR